VSSSDLTFVTGASGFVGSAVVRALIRSGYAVRALVRRDSPRVNLDGLDVGIVEGDIRDADAVAIAAKGARYVLHVAADYRLWASDPDEITRTNVEGTRVVMTAAQAAGVERVVYTSSVATLKLDGRGRPADETRPLPRMRRLEPTSVARSRPSGSLKTWWRVMVCRR
jgi:dihydroflavonol-4-reductase